MSCDYVSLVQSSSALYSKKRLRVILENYHKLKLKTDCLRSFNFQKFSLLWLNQTLSKFPPCFSVSFVISLVCLYLQRFWHLHLDVRNKRVLARFTYSLHVHMNQFSYPIQLPLTCQYWNHYIN